MSDREKEHKEYVLRGGQYRPLQTDQLGRIHETALRVLEEVGVKVECEEARKPLLDAGARTSGDGQRLTMRPTIVERALQSAPSKVILYGREESSRLTAAGRRTHFGTGGAAVEVLDLDTGERRKSRLSDIAHFARIVESLPNIHFFVRPCAAQDVPQEHLAVNEFYACLANTTRHVMGAAYTPEGTRQVLDMASLIAGSREALIERPFLTLIVGWMNSPLRFDTLGSQTLMEAVRAGIPVALTSAPMAGSTSPLTLAGTLVQLHAEELAGIVFAQAVRPGTPLLYGGIPSMADMHRLTYIGGGVEFGMMNAAIAQLAHYVQLPNYNSAGVTEAKIPDMQAMVEKSFAILQCALSGSNFVHHAAGMLESLLTVSYEELIIDNEIIGMAMRAVRGIEVDEDRLGFDAIKEAVGEGTYLLSEHTTRHLRTEFFEPMLSDRHDREQWEKLGAQDIRDKARDKAKEIIEAAPPNLLSPALDQQIRSLFPVTATP